jgi:hypothetical protein
MMLDVSLPIIEFSLMIATHKLTHFQDPTVQKFTGKKDRIDVMGALREAKNKS